MIVLGVALNYLEPKYTKFCSLFFIFIFLFNNDFLKSYFVPSTNNYVKIFERTNLMVDICKEFRFEIKSKQHDSTLFYLKYWHNKFDDEKINLLCKELGI